MSVTINGTSGLTFNDASTQNTAAKVGMVNRIINGDCRIDQRNAGASGTGANQYTIDRWAVYMFPSTKGTWQQNAGGVTPPVGFTNYLGFTTTSAYSVTSSDEFLFYQSVEGFNTADLAFGTTNASTFTMSFWVRSSLTGTFGGSFRNANATRSYPFSYTISSANTWEYKTITVAGDSTGTWNTTNGVGISVHFSMGAGSGKSATAGSWQSGNFVSATGATSVVGTDGATFYITGVQLEKGSTATSFDYRPYGTELALCQRYGWRIADGSATRVATGTWNSSTSADVTFTPPVIMRATPTLTVSSNGTLLDYALAWYNGTSVTLSNESSSKFITLTVAVASSSSAQGKGAAWGASAGVVPSAFLSAEL